jgi:hypothetical protein
MKGLHSQEQSLYLNKGDKMLRRNILIIGLLLALSGHTQAQAISSDFQKNCIQEQLEEHKNIKKKSLDDEDFKSYCRCLAEYISKNANNKQVDELVMQPKARPEWLKVIELKAMKSCIVFTPKMKT